MGLRPGVVELSNKFEGSRMSRIMSVIGGDWGVDMDTKVVRTRGQETVVSPVVGFRCNQVTSILAGHIPSLGPSHTPRRGVKSV